MDFRDLLAWQQVQALAVGPLGAPGLLPIIGSDSSRIYLSVSLQFPVAGAVFMVPRQGAKSTDAGLPMNAVLPAGEAQFVIDPVGVAWTTDTSNPIYQSAYVAGSLADVDIPASLTPFLPPVTREFWLDRHGALCQSAWSLYDPFGTVALAVITVTMERNPCDYTSTGQAMPGKPRSMPRGRSVLSTPRPWGHHNPALRRGRDIFRPADGGERSPGTG